MVEIARALRVDEMVHASPLVILDEPTSVLERDETEVLEREIRDLKKIGSVIFVSHRLDEVLRICDRRRGDARGEIVAERRHRGRHRGRALRAHDRPQRARRIASARPRGRQARADAARSKACAQGTSSTTSRSPWSARAHHGDRRHERVRPGVGLPRDLRRRAVRRRRAARRGRAGAVLVDDPGGAQRHGVRALRAARRRHGRRDGRGGEPHAGAPGRGPHAARSCASARGRRSRPTGSSSSTCAPATPRWTSPASRAATSRRS